ncbi:NUDIX domain-containing protein [Chromobacterium amazonense]|uniref:NUDIX domain-containing protein n=1 Tax=Chromobacterium amazonense TaxID=1382803 RepID=UPI000582456F|nr:NUDIX domain-containing protein [Chromobacterium amazonense]KIA81782.1 NUDIX hydrolase [Chromobacterium piscinae]MBM2885181.1 NUDIX domain-containing protein [Chromobacterium amazonense]MDE1714472.1 NUDIX domain-containing protein [Chromobacterium amazonense]
MPRQPLVSHEAVLQAIETLRAAVGSARDGLPEEVFLFVSSLTPMVNVDLLIRDEQDRTLLTWRHDRFYGPGWHVPGGIIRFKESSAERIAAVAAKELGVEVGFDPRPLCQHEMFNRSRDVRGHFISLLHACRLLTPLDEARRFDPEAPRNGDWAWHDGAPDNLIRVHEIYRPFLDGRQTGSPLPSAQVSHGNAEDHVRNAHI